MPDDGSASNIEWPGLTSSAVTQTPAPNHQTTSPNPAGGFQGTDSAGNFYFNWSTHSSDAGTQGGFLKLNVDGSLAWQVAIDATQLTTYSGSVNGTGEVVIAGIAPQPNGGSTAYTAKYTPDGVLAWSAQFQHRLTPITLGFVASMEPDESVVSAAYVNLPSVDFGQNVIVLIKYAPDGTQLWTKGYCEDSDDVPTSMVTDSAGNIYVSTSYNTFAFTADGTPLFSSPLGGTLALSADESAIYVFNRPLLVGTTQVLAKIDIKTGVFDWRAHFAMTTQGSVTEVWNFLATSGGLYIVGRTSAILPFWARFDEQGNQQWFEQWAPSLPNGTVDRTNAPLFVESFYDPTGAVIGMSDGIPGTNIWKIGPDGTPLSF